MQGNGNYAVEQHSMAYEVGQGRPDDKDLAEIRAFATRVLEKIECGISNDFIVLGNIPYKQSMKHTATPISLPVCILCKNAKKSVR